MGKSFVCIVMAAGAASRFGGGKLRHLLAGKTVMERTLDAIPKDCFSRVLVVAGEEELLRMGEERGFETVINDRPEQGASRTVRLGLAAAGECDAAMFLAADQPLLQRETVRRLVMTSIDHPDRIAALAHDGVRGNPCIFPANYFPELAALEGDRGGSAVIRRHPDELILVEASAWELKDIDRPEDLEEMERYLRA